MGDPAKTIIMLGIVLVIAGLLMLVVQRTWFPGKLPGDIVIRKEHFTFYVPLGTSIVISIIISLILYLVGKFR
jgi:hypothetical protein